MALTSLKLTPEEKAKKAAEYQPTADTLEDYPWGVELCLDDLAVQKLGIGQIAVGATVRIEAVARVDEAGEEMINGKPERRLTLQITDMAVTPDSGRPAEQVLYDSGEA